MPTVLHVSSLPFFTVSLEKRAGMPSLTMCVREFVRRGWKVVFAYPADHPSAPYRADGIHFLPIYSSFFDRNNSSFVFWRRKFYSAYIPIFIMRLWPVLRKISPQLLYAHGYMAAPVAKFLRVFSSSPLIVRLYGFCHADSLLSDHPYHFTNLKCVWRDIPERLALWVNADLYVVTADGTHGEKVLSKFGLAKKAMVLRNAVDVPHGIDDLSPITVRKALHLPPHRTIVTYIGRLEDFKRPDRILDAAAEAKCMKKPWLFVIVGEGRDRTSLEFRAARDGLSDYVKFVGAVPQEKVWKYLRASDVFLSLHDLSALSNTLLEALALGKTVVCSHRGNGVRDLVVPAHGGYLVDDPDDPKEVIQKIETALAMPRNGWNGSVRIESWSVRLDKEFARIQNLLNP